MGRISGVMVVWVQKKACKWKVELQSLLSCTNSVLGVRRIKEGSSVSWKQVFMLPNVPSAFMCLNRTVVEFFANILSLPIPLWNHSLLRSSKPWSRFGSVRENVPQCFQLNRHHSKIYAVIRWISGIVVIWTQTGACKRNVKLQTLLCCKNSVLASDAYLNVRWSHGNRCLGFQTDLQLLSFLTGPG